ncbi:hypothetical protein BC834DRAFT_874448 [Gloeopeniophorella convolvens]|nr:hypothetical protein BC834DRAFT_874448 [Gloeopeniophorella convolvens]
MSFLQSILLTFTNTPRDEVDVIVSPPGSSTTVHDYSASSTSFRPQSSRPVPHTGMPICFYDADKPYYEFTNFSPHPVEYDGRVYPTAEHLYQAFKFFSTSPATAEHIRTLPSPRAAQQEAKRHISKQRRDWMEANMSVMDEVLAAKFAQHRSLRHLLRNTGSRELIEDSPIDWFWGIGSDNTGRNELGKALMRLRERLQAKSRSRY